MAEIKLNLLYEPVFSRQTSATDALGRTTTFSINAANGNLNSITQPVVGGQTPVTSFTYNARGQVLTVTDPVGKVTLSAYDAANGNLLSVMEDQGAGRLNLLTSFAYNAVGDAITTTDPRGNMTQVAYDLERRVTQTTSPAPFNLVAKTTYNADGNVIKLERQTNVAAAPWQTSTFSYSLSGKALTATDPSGNVTATAYDALDRVKQVTDAENRVSKFTYAAGRLFREIDPLGQTRAEYAYTPNGQRLSLKDANGTVTLYSYDGFDRLARQTYTDATFEELAYDAAGNVLSRRNRAGQTATFAYDPLNRVTTKTPVGLPVVSYSYDLAGKVLSVSDSAGAFSVDNDPLNATDPYGECPACIGAGAGFLVELAFQAYSGELQGAISSAYNGDYGALGVSAAKILVSTGTGAATGGISSATRVITYSAAAGFGSVGAGAKAIIDGDDDIRTEALLGGIGGIAGAGAGQATRAAINGIAPRAAEVFGTAIRAGISAESKIVSGVVQRLFNTGGDNTGGDANDVTSVVGGSTAGRTQNGRK